MKRYIFSLAVLALIAHGVGGAGASVVTHHYADTEAKIEQASK